jgi:hypothetical protein
MNPKGQADKGQLRLTPLEEALARQAINTQTAERRQIAGCRQSRPNSAGEKPRTRHIQQDQRYARTYADESRG